VDAFFTACSKPMKCLRKWLSGGDINSDPIVGKASVGVNSYLFDEVGLPPNEFSQEVIHLLRILEEILSFELLGESAIVFTFEENS
jgi:hypothetical protein